MEDERDQHKSLLPLQNDETISSVMTKDIPTIDLSNPNGELVAREVAKASEEWGIFQAVNHGIPAELLWRLQEVGKRFFELPEEEKQAVAKPAGSKDVQGYETNDVDGKKGRVHHIFHNLSPPSSVNYTYWPTNPPEYRGLTEEYARHAKNLAEKILGLLSEGLGLQCESLKVAFGDDMAGYMLKIINYPPCPQSDLVMGLSAHTDINGLTLLLPNEIRGLQVFKDGCWLDAEYKSPAIIVVIGDQIMRMSNGRYNNVLHRILMDKEKTRISWVILVKPDDNMVVKPFPELTSEQNPPKFEPLTYKEYRDNSYQKKIKMYRDNQHKKLTETSLQLTKPDLSNV